MDTLECRETEPSPGFLPLGEVLPTGHAPWFDVDAISIPAGEFTGDFYFATEIDGALWFAVGDVSGKGLEAALVMALLQEELERIVHDWPSADPSEVVACVDATLRAELPGNKFVTLVLGRVGPDLQLRIVNAGHCEPMLVRFRRSHACGETSVANLCSIGSNGPVVGILASSNWQEETIQLRHDDRLVIYTDGLLEATAPNGEELGSERIRRHLEKTAGDSIVEELLSAADRFSAGAQHDDLTLFVLTIR